MRSRGFLQWAEGYIRSNPGLSAQDIAKAYLSLNGVSSGAQDPPASLVATLHKNHSDQGRSIVRRRESGAYLFYPANPVDEFADSSGPGADEQPSPRITSVQLDKYVRLADDLAAVGKFKSQREALVWLIRN